ncbi:hypothetical protein [Thalassoglobus neptunius]|uniref:hypothetical protein n=1 Tax=Thalassoglobus neptunius TaxID=1938619 RepID=UPI001E32E9C5|nr:hypothetical protein [Thalassoglobus neptunius]
MSQMNGPSGLIAAIPFLVVCFGLIGIARKRGSLSPFHFMAGTACILSCLLWLPSNLEAAELGLIGCGLCLTLFLVATILYFTQISIPAQSYQQISPQTDHAAPVQLETIPSEFLNFQELQEEHCDTDNVTQSWTRSVVEGELDQLEGVFTVEFAEGHRIVHFHIPVFPPFHSIPEGWCEADDDSYKVSLTQLYSYGTRVTVRRSGNAAEADTVQVNVVLSCPLPNRSAA